MSNKPFIHLFETDKNKYIYDVNSNEIIIVNNIIFDYFHLLISGIDSNECRSMLSAYYETDEIKKNINYIQEVQEANLYFSKTHPKNISLFCCKDNLKHTCDNYVNQLILEVTKRCNLNCRYCVYSGIYEQSRLHENTDMNWEMAKTGLDFMIQHGGKDPDDHMTKRSRERKEIETDFTISFYGGEPLLNFELIRECINYSQLNAPEKKIGYAITTNGTLLSDDIIEYFIKNGVTITISFDGPKHIHDRFRIFNNGEGTHDDVFDAINRINRIVRKMSLSNTLNCVINCLITGDMDYKELLEYFSSLEDILLNDFVHFDVRLTSLTGGIEKWNDSYPDEQIKIPTGFDNLIEEYKLACIKGIYEKGKDVSFYHQLLHNFTHDSFYFNVHSRTRHQFANEYEIRENSHPGSICIVGTRRPFLTTDGRILPCERVPYDNPHMVVGHSNTGLDIDKISVLLDDFTNSTIDECRNCWCYRMCDAGCIHDNYINGIFDEKIKLEHCTRIRAHRHSEMVGMMRLLEEHPSALDHYNDIVSS